MITQEEFKANKNLPLTGKTTKVKGMEIIHWYEVVNFVRENYPDVRIVQNPLERDLIETYFIRGNDRSSVYYYPVSDSNYRTVKNATGCALMDAMNRALCRAVAMEFGFGLTLWLQVEAKASKHPVEDEDEDDEEEDDDDDDDEYGEDEEEEDEEEDEEDRPVRRRSTSRRSSQKETKSRRTSRGAFRTRGSRK